MTTDEIFGTSTLPPPFPLLVTLLWIQATLPWDQTYPLRTPAPKRQQSS
jgi:hypothetical protein